MNNLQEFVCFWPTTPPLPTSSIDAAKITTSRTIHTLKQQASSLFTKNVPVGFWGKLNTFVKKSIVQVTTAGLVTKQLQEIETAQNAQKLHQNQNQRVVQRGGVMYVHEARSMMHWNKLAQAKKLVAQKTARQTRKATAL